MPRVLLPGAGGRGGGAGGGGAGGPEFLINLGASHPSAHGMLRLRLTLDGDRITAAEPEIGFMHRGAEKLFEARDYRQIIVLANRHDWLGAFASELGVVLAAERLAGIEVPPRAVWARTMLAELNRVLSHLAFLSSYPPEIAAGPRPAQSREAGPGEPARGAGRVPGPRGHPIDHGGDLRRPDALHVQPGRRAQGGDSGRLAGPGLPRHRRGARGAARDRGHRGRGRLPRPHQGRRGADPASRCGSTG